MVRATGWFSLRRLPVPGTLGREFVGYFLASVAGLAVDVAALELLVRALGVGYLWGATAGFLLGALAVYALSVRLIFQERRVPVPPLEFAIFVLLGCVGLAATLLVMWLGMERLHFSLEVSKLISAGTGFLMNFALRKTLLFSRPGIR